MPSGTQILRMSALEPGPAEVLPAPAYLDGYGFDGAYAKVVRYAWPGAYRVHALLVFPQDASSLTASNLAIQFKDEHNTCLVSTGFRAEHANIDAIFKRREWLPVEVEVATGDVWTSTLVSAVATPGVVVYLALVSPRERRVT